MIMFNLIVALEAEAKPIISALELKKYKSAVGFKIYDNETTNLIISGTGSLASATACAYLCGVKQQKRSSVWLNIGIAGSHHDDVGQDFLAHKIIDGQTQLLYYPSLCIETPCPTRDIITVAEPESTYEHAAVYDMEAAGFFFSANKMTTTELIHSYKVISDNCNYSHTKVTKHLATELISAKIDTIILLMGRLKQLQLTLETIYKPHFSLGNIIKQWHFTVTQQKQLEQLLRRWNCVATQSVDDFISLHQPGSAREFLRKMENELANIPVQF